MTAAGSPHPTTPPREDAIPDVGDRVVIVSDGNPNGFGGQFLREHKGKHGVVLSNDGWGRCSVRLDDGSVVDCWNAADLGLEAARG